MKQNRPPNIILIIMDTVRADHCSTWGYERLTTPFLTGLAGKSTIYSQVVSPSSWTLPTHVSLFSGLFPSEHGVMTGQDTLSKDIPLLAEVLQDQGYLTAGFTNNPWVSSIRGLERGFEIFEEIFQGRRIEDKSVAKLNLDRLRHLLFLEDNGADLTNDQVKKWLLSSRQEEDNNPVFLFINYMEAHQVYNPKRPYHREFSGGINSYLEMIQNRNIARNKADIYAGLRSITADRYQTMINMYDRSIVYLDNRISRLVSFLDQHLDPQNTMLIITSDHGDNFGEHSLNGVGLIDHLFSLHDSLIRVPLLIRYPGVFIEGEVSDDLVQLNDIFHTILTLLDIKQERDPRWWESNLISGEKRHFAFSEYETPRIQLERFRNDCHKGNFDPYDVRMKSISSTKHKLIQNEGASADFYDLVNDPLEQRNLIGSGLDAEQDLRDKISAWLDAVEAKQQESEDKQEIVMNEVIRNRLIDLGYL